MKVTLRLKFILFTTILVMIIMANITYFFTIRELNSRRTSMESQINRIARNIATMQLLDRQDWSVYQNYISQLMDFNTDIVYIAIYDARKALRAQTLNANLIDSDRPLLSRRLQADLVKKLDNGGVAEESRQDIQSVRVNIQVGDRILGSVHVGFSLIDINKEQRNGILLNVFLAFIFLIFFCLVAIYMSRRLTRPLENLTSAMDQVNAGNLNQRVQAETRDEIALLTRSFNAMVEGMRERSIIDNLGHELSAKFTIDQLAEIVRERLRKAIGADQARLYIRRKQLDNTFYEITLAQSNGPDFPSLHLSEYSEKYLNKQNEGVMIHSVPDHVLKDLRHSRSDENGLVVTMQVKNELFGMIFFALPKDKDAFNRQQRHFASTLAGQAALALENAFLYEDLRDQERLKRELEIAREMQTKLLPDVMPELDGFQIDAICEPAQEVGGDYYDFFELDPNRLGVVIADVSGKGTSASFYMAELKGIMMQLTSDFSSPKELMAALNRKLFKNIERSSFITMIYGILDTENNSFTFSRAGHNSLIKISPDSYHKILTPSGIGLGLNEGHIFNEELEEVTVSIEPQDSLVLYTDGLVEAMNKDELEYGEERLYQTAVAAASNNCDTLRKVILDDLSHFMKQADPHDDITLVLIKRISEK